MQDHLAPRHLRSPLMVSIGHFCGLLHLLTLLSIHCPVHSLMVLCYLIERGGWTCRSPHYANVSGSVWLGAFMWAEVWTLRFVKFRWCYALLVFLLSFRLQHWIMCFSCNLWSGDEHLKKIVFWSFAEWAMHRRVYIGIIPLRNET